MPFFYENFSMMDNLKALIEKGIRAAAYGRMSEAENFFKSYWDIAGIIP